MTARNRAREKSLKPGHEPACRSLRPYAPPSVERWGSIRELTAGGAGPLPDGGATTRSTT